MRKEYLCFIIVAALILLRAQFCYGAPAYGTHMPEERKWTWGLEYNAVVDRDLDNDEGGAGGDRYFLTGSYGIFSWFSFDGKIGVGDVDWDRNKADKLSYSTNFAGGYGFRIKGYENEVWGIRSAVGFQHISVHPEAKNQGGSKNETIVDEWQGSVVVSKDIGNLIPYVGVRYGTFDLIKWTNEADRKRIKAEESYGLIVGFDYRLSETTRLNLEAAFMDGEEFAFGISRDF